MNKKTNICCRRPVPRNEGKSEIKRSKESSCFTDKMCAFNTE